MAKTYFEIWKESKIEMRNRGKDYTVKDLEEFSQSRSDYFHERIARFDTLEEARTAFEEEKKYCSTYKTDGYTFPLILFDELQLNEIEYEIDDDGDEEFIQDLGTWDSYIEELN